jgi:ergothioneine biosynthesis protein EgtB
MDPWNGRAQYQQVRDATVALAAPLSAEDQMVQAMPDASPTKWHLAHTTWFFETFVLAAAEANHAPFDRAFKFLFNSYYESVGQRHERPGRGWLSRPSLEEVHRYRRDVDARMAAIFERLDKAALEVVGLGMHHEQQHQELILTDIKHALSVNPLRPVYRARGAADAARGAPAVTWHAFDEGVFSVGHEGAHFAFDNEGPRHRVFLEPFAIASRPVTSGEYLAFMRDGGYRRPEFWLSAGWAAVHERGWQAPMYWEERDRDWWRFTLAGMAPVDLEAPVSHVSYFEADAYARWAGARLPTEFEWERASVGPYAEPMLAHAASANFVESGRFDPAPAVKDGSRSPAQMLGDVWEWTQSAYGPYPGYATPPGALGEYNGKFMSGQMVLRGGSCVTPASHIRATYRNFFPPDARWQFSGIRLARQP